MQSEQNIIQDINVLQLTKGTFVLLFAVLYSMRGTLF